MENEEYFLKKGEVAINQNNSYEYGKKAPFNPNKIYPEFDHITNIKIDENNTAYEAVRKTLFLLGLDKENYNKKSWNPFKEIIKPEDKVVIKPNAVASTNNRKNDSWESVITHGSIIRAVADYVYIALNGKGKIIIADAPLAHTDFEDWKTKTGMTELVRYYKEIFNFDLAVYDLRQLYVPYSKLGYARASKRDKKERDPMGYALVDLKEKSKFANIPEEELKLFYGSDYDRSETVKHHLNGKHEYLVSKTILDADVLISLPKLKTHKKVGTTLNLKAMVGTIGDKNYIPHYKIGDGSRKGDEYPNMGPVKNFLNRYRMYLTTKCLSKKKAGYDLIYFFGNILYHVAKKTIYLFDKIIGKKKNTNLIHGGSWPGNDTACRMAIDLIYITLYSDINGIIQSKPQRRFFSLIDGIVGGDLDGPLSPRAKKSKVLVAGYNPLAVDLVSTRLMGFDPKKIKMYQYALEEEKLKNFKEIKILSENEKYKYLFEKRNKYLNFKSPESWEGFIYI